MRSMARWFAVAILLLTSAAVAGCGVRLQQEAVPVPASVIPAPLRVPPLASAASPAPKFESESATSRLRLWFVEEDGLSAVESTLPVGTTPDVIVQALAVGPTPVQAEQGLRTVAGDPLTGLPFVSVAATAGSATPSPDGTASDSFSSPPGPIPTVTVMLSPAFTSLPSGEQVLLLGQVVLSLAGAGERSIAFTDEVGTSLAVPLPDGRLLDGAATARDYSGLIVRP